MVVVLLVVSALGLAPAFVAASSSGGGSKARKSLIMWSVGALVVALPLALMLQAGRRRTRD